MAPRKTTSPSSKTRTLLITRGAQNRFGGPDAPSGRVKITIPATAKVTFGMMQPGVKGGHGVGDGSTLRIYEGTKQTAVFQNVVEFRDEAYPLEVEVIEESSEHDATVVDGKTVKASSDRRRTGVFMPADQF